MVGVEASVLSAAVTGILKIVSNKLAPLVIKEYSSIVGVAKDLQELQDLVQEINSLLETAGDRATVDARWLKKLKEVAYNVDDVVDEFQLKAEKHDADGGGGGFVSRYLHTKGESFIFQCKAAKKIKKIKKRFAKIVKQRTDLTAIFGHDPVSHINKSAVNMQTLPVPDEAAILGRDQEMHQIISNLVETNDKQEIKIVSIVGLGGSGKTTLAKLVFNDEKTIEKHFEVRLWVHVSQEFDFEKIIKKLYEAFADKDVEQSSLPYMNKRVQKGLTKKKFLIVMDDVWTESQNQWDKIMGYLKTGAPGSRILLTTHSKNVAEVVRSTYQLCLRPLSPDDSWQLFQQSFRRPEKFLESDFIKAGKEIVKKCGGVPLAIKVIAGYLGGMERIEEWQAMKDKNLSNVNGKEGRVATCLWLSYFHLPSNLKQCFTICSVFPKGYKIDKEQLIDLWIAHDMITTEDDDVDYLDLEYVGHKQFDCLVQVFFLQNVEEEGGRVKCEMHDLVHDLALNILGNEILLVMPREATNSTNRYRYVSCIEEPKNSVPANIFEKTRALYVTSRHNYKYGMALKYAMHLRSITVAFVGMSAISSTIFQVKYLKYLSMSGLHCEKLPEAISDVWSLQALHVTHSYYLVELPESIGRLKKLRALNLSGCEYLKSLPESIGDCQIISRICLLNCIELKVLPNSIGKLQKLRTLNLSRCQGLKCLPESIGYCQMISSINLSNCWELAVLPDSIGKLHKLRTLDLSLCRRLKCLPDSIGDCQMIASIDLCYCCDFTGLPESIGRNEKLRVLILHGTKIESLPSTFTALRNLECLDLQGCYGLVELPEGIGNMEKLQVLNLKYCRKLGGMPVGIGHLVLLENFVVGKGENFSGISELANVSGDKLTIRGIPHGMDPNDAHKACLKQKTNLQRLGLMWVASDMEEVSTKLEQDVLDGLEPPLGIKELEIHAYLGRQYARWMQNQLVDGVRGHAPFPFLRVMKLMYFPNLKHIHELVESPCLEELYLGSMLSLESISGGPFPSLVKLKMECLPSLGEVWMVAERSIPDGEEWGGCSNFTPQLGQVRVGNCLTKLDIIDCPKLEVKPHFPQSLQHLYLWDSELVLQLTCQRQVSSSSPGSSHPKKLELLWKVTGLGAGHGWEQLQHMKTLESLEIKYYRKLTQLPENLGSFTSLRSLEVSACSRIRILPESIGELRGLQELTIKHCDRLSSLPQSMRNLTSLQSLKIGWCDALQHLPDCLGELCCLSKFVIRGLPWLTCLPQSICRLISLQELEIYDCPRIKSLPEGIKDLTTLSLFIWDCPDLERRCERWKGEDWHLISHIRNYSIWNPHRPNALHA